MTVPVTEVNRGIGAVDDWSFAILRYLDIWMLDTGRLIIANIYVALMKMYLEKTCSSKRYCPIKSHFIACYFIPKLRASTFIRKLVTALS